MKVEILAVHGLEIAAKAVRRSFNSVSKRETLVLSEGVQLWKDDAELLSGLIYKGDSHAKVMRMCSVWMDITAPRYFWQEFDQSRVGVTSMSDSTSHKITSRHLCVDDFEDRDITVSALEYINYLIDQGDLVRVKRYLPEGFLQTRTVHLNYQVLRHIYFDRRNHRLPIWHEFIKEMDKLPFCKEFIKVEKEKS